MQAQLIIYSDFYSSFRFATVLSYLRLLISTRVLLLGSDGHLFFCTTGNDFSIIQGDAKHLKIYRTRAII